MAEHPAAEHAQRARHLDRERKAAAPEEVVAAAAEKAAPALLRLLVDLAAASLALEEGGEADPAAHPERAAQVILTAEGQRAERVVGLVGPAGVGHLDQVAAGDDLDGPHEIFG